MVHNSLETTRTVQNYPFSPKTVQTPLKLPELLQKLPEPLSKLSELPQNSEWTDIRSEKCTSFLQYYNLCDVISHILRIWKIFWFLTIVFSCQQSFWCLFWRTLPLIWATHKYGPYIPNYIKSAYNKTPPCCRWNHRSFHSQSNNKYWRWLDCLTQQKGTEPARRITRNTFESNAWPPIEITMLYHVL